MNSTLPKSLHKVSQITIMEHILCSLLDLNLSGICVVLWEQNYELFLPVIDRFKQKYPSHPPFAVCLQRDPGGTAYAAACVGGLWPKHVLRPSYCHSRVLQGFDGLTNTPGDSVLICPGDTPALCQSTLKQLMSEHSLYRSQLSLIGCYFDPPFGYGRMVCDDQGQLRQVVEQKDATLDQQRIRLCYSGVMMAQTKPLFDWLAQVEPNTITGEYYLTDVIAWASRSQVLVHHLVADKWQCFLGVNSQKQRSVVEDLMSCDSAQNRSSLISHR